MKLKQVPFEVSVCQLPSLAGFSLATDFFGIMKTEKEISLVCKTEDVPGHIKKRADGWRGFFIAEELDFSLIGILAKISTLLAGEGISIFAVSTYATDYFFVKNKDLARALALLAANGYEVL